jgi:hypothetical protein
MHQRGLFLGFVQDPFRNLVQGVIPRDQTVSGDVRQAADNSCHEKFMLDRGFFKTREKVKDLNRSFTPEAWHHNSCQQY